MDENSVSPPPKVPHQLNQCLPVGGLVRRVIKILQRDHPLETAEGMLHRLGLSATPQLLALFCDAGFVVKSIPVDPDRQADIIAALASGIWSPLVIADELQCTVDSVHQVISHSGYGLQLYGSSYGGRCKSYSENGGPVNRRVNIVGQMSYRRRAYSLGRAYRGRVAIIRENGGYLDITFGDKPHLHLAKRP